MKNISIIYTTSKIITYKNGSLQGTGSSFFVKNKKQIYLVTCYHIIKDCDEIRILLLSEGYEHVEKNKITLNKRDFSIIENDDLAWTNITSQISSLLEKDIRLLIKAFDLNLSIDYISEDIDILNSVYFIGYPSGIIDSYNLIPIVRKSNFSTPYKMNFDNKNQFLIDGSVFPGSSGSPVFINIDNQKILVGVVIGTFMTEENEGKQYLLLGIVSKISTLLKKL